MRYLLISAFLIFLTACSSSEQVTASPASSAEFAVAMPDKFAAQVALDVMQDGGNAVDAAIAAQFVLAVTYPEAGNIGGGGFMTIYMDQHADFLDYREMAPAQGIPRHVSG